MALSPAAPPPTAAPAREQTRGVVVSGPVAGMTSYKPSPPRHGIAEAYVPSPDDIANALPGLPRANWVVRLLRFFGL